MASWLQFSIAFFLSLFIGSLVEYVVHRLMHAGKFLHKVHAKHHQLGEGQGWLLEFKDYILPGLAISWLGFLVSIPAGIGYAAGCVVYAALAAYAHQVQHEKPELVFWLPRPVHHLHHSKKMWHHNFGILVDFWDRVFGTYKPVDEETPYERPKLTFSSYFKIRWF
jgi:sterol desaturase/sphingolipid hydroxylase (fatty acid hydroxylase superfamily)